MFIIFTLAQCVLIFEVYAQYNKNVECIIDKDNFPKCKTIKSIERRTNNLNTNMPLYEPYIPRMNSVLYNCTITECKPYKLFSITQLSHPTSNLKHCFLETPDKYACETVKYNYYKNIDKLLFLANNIPTKIFYLADCLIYSDGERVCHRKDDTNSHAKLVDIGTIARPNENNVLSLEEFICEQADTKVNCDFNHYVSYPTGLRPKEDIKVANKILLKTDLHLVPLKYKCSGSWCGFSGNILLTRRSMFGRDNYDTPGGSVYRCYYAKKQQVCKKLYGRLRSVYNERDWLST